jgi:hypothetical protein
MKNLILAGLSAATLLSFSACTTVVDKREPSVHRTTSITEESTVRRPIVNVIETRTLRTY